MARPSIEDRRRFRWFRFRLRTLFVVLTLAAIGFAAWSSTRGSYYERRALAGLPSNTKSTHEWVGPDWLGKWEQHLPVFRRVDYLKYRGLDLSRAKFQQLRHLTYLRELSLRELSLAETPVLGEDLMYLARLPRLEKLDLSEGPVTDEGLRWLAKIPSLRELHLDFTLVSDAGLMHLNDHPALELLVVGHTNVTDEGLDQLTNLQRLFQKHSGRIRVSPQRRAELIRVLETDGSYNMRRTSKGAFFDEHKFGLRSIAERRRSLSCPRRSHSLSVMAVKQSDHCQFGSYGVQGVEEVIIMGESTECPIVFPSRWFAPCGEFYLTVTDHAKVEFDRLVFGDDQDRREFGAGLDRNPLGGEHHNVDIVIRDGATVTMPNIRRWTGKLCIGTGRLQVMGPATRLTTHGSLGVTALMEVIDGGHVMVNAATIRRNGVLSIRNGGSLQATQSVALDDGRIVLSGKDSALAAKAIPSGEGPTALQIEIRTINKVRIVE